VAPQLWPARVICFALAAAALAVFWGALRCDFVNYDDPTYVTSNAEIQHGLTAEGFAWAFETPAASNWHPLTWLSHMADVQVFGLKPAGHHLTSVLLHAANAVLLFLLLQRITGALWRSAAVAALFAWHPAHVESVAWIAERKDVLCAFFGLLTLGAYLRYAENLKSQISSFKFFYGLSLLLFALGLMSKPMLVTWPFVLLLLDYWPLGRMSRVSLPRLVMEKTPFLALSAACCVWTIWAQQQSHAVASAGGLPVSRRLGHVLASYLDYMVMLIFPRHLAIYYPYPAHDPIAMIMGGAAVLVLLSILAIATARRRPWWPVGWFWFVGMLVPVIGFVQVGDQAMADRYTYLPSVGLFLILAWSVAELAVRFPAVKLFAPAVGLVLLAATWTQVHYWKNTRTVFERALQVTQSNYVALTLLGSLRETEGNLEGAMEYYREALHDKPYYPDAHFFYARGLEEQGKAEQAKAEYAKALYLNPEFQQAHIFLGLLLAKEKKYDQAAAEYEAVLKINPRSATAHNDLGRLLQTQGRLDESLQHYLAAVKFDSSVAQAHNNLGVLYVQKGQLSNGVVQLREALRLNPGNAESEYNLALALNQQQQWKEACALWQRLAPAQPNNAGPQYQYGLALAREGKTREAMSQFARALLLTPDFAEALNELAWIAATDPRAEFRNGGEAVAMAGRACELTARRQPAMLLTLAAACAEAGRWSEALASARESQETANAKGNKDLAEKAARLLDIFATGKPYREPAAGSQ